MKKYEDTRDEFIKERYITCQNCGYNNNKQRLEIYGTCLCCGKIIDERTYFKKKLGGKLYVKKS